MSRFVLIRLGYLGLTIVFAVSGVADAAEPSRVASFDLEQVQLLDGPFLRARERVRKYLRSLDADRLLYNFRVTAGVPSAGVQPYGGWETPDSSLRGNFLGHYLSACSRMVVSTGDPALKARVDFLVDALGHCQKKSRRGYLAGFPETFFDTLEGGRLGVPGGSVPYYSMHKLLAGLRDAYRYCNNKPALAIMVGLAEWIRERTTRLSDEAMARILMVEFGGMNEVLYDLHSITGADAHLVLARRFDHEWLFGPLARAQDNLTALHGNTTAPKIVGAARAYEVTGEQRYRDIATFSWQQIAEHRVFVTGGSTRYETFQDFPDRLCNNLDRDNQEYCVTYNLLKLGHQLFRWSPDPRYPRYSERALTNHVLSVINPRSAMVAPKIGLASGMHKGFTDPHNDFGCCLGTSCETFAGVQENIYFRGDSALYVNFFVPSVLDWSEKRLRLTQHSDLPRQSKVKITVDCEVPTRLTLNLFIPGWATRDATLRVGAEKARPVEVAGGNYLILNRSWPEGKSTVELDLPSRLHVQRMPDDESYLAFLYGPLVLATRLTSPSATDVTANTSFLKKLFLVTKSDNLEEWIHPIPDRPLAFRITGQDLDYELVPFSSIVDDPYRVYWRAYREGSKAHRDYLSLEERWKDLVGRTVDAVNVGREVVEVHARGSSTHEMQMRNYIWGQREGREFFYTRPGGGGFSVTLKVREDQPVSLSCIFWGSAIGHLYDVFVDGTKVASSVVEKGELHSFIAEEYEISPDLTRGKDRIRVELSDRADSVHAPVFDCRIVDRK